MSKIDVIRELHCYKKMYHLMQNTVIDCVDTCKDPIIKSKLIKAQQDAENIYTGEEYEIRRDLTVDEIIIILLLSFIREREASREFDVMDIDIIRESVDWLLILQNKKIKLTEEFINQQVAKIFHPENEEKDSGQK